MMGPKAQFRWIGARKEYYLRMLVDAINEGGKWVEAAVTADTSCNLWTTTPKV
jgi:hypothetical protein